MCNHCQHYISRTDGSTTNMRNHLKRSHPKNYVEFTKAAAKQLDEKAQQEEDAKAAEEGLEQSATTLAEATSAESQVRKRPITSKQISSFFPIKYKANSDLQRRFDLETAVYMVTGNLSFKHMESQALQRFVAYLNPKLQVKSRSTLSRKLVPILYKNLKAALDNFFSEELIGKIPGVSFTSDEWVSRNFDKYLALTLHMIDSRWVLRHFAVHCKKMEGSSTGNNIMLVIDRMIDNITINPEAITTMVTDGASQMKKAMGSCLNISEHLVCVDHTIQNCLKDAFAAPEVKPAIEKAQALARATHKSPKMNSMIREECSKANSKLEYSLLVVVTLADPRVTSWGLVLIFLDQKLQFRYHFTTSSVSPNLAVKKANNLVNCLTTF